MSKAKDTDRLLIAAIGFFGPDDQTATKATVSIVRGESEILFKKSWQAKSGDVRQDAGINHAIVEYISGFKVEKVVFTSHILGCPHEPGKDFPLGEDCPLCPFWSRAEN